MQHKKFDLGEYNYEHDALKQVTWQINKAEETKKENPTTRQINERINRE